MRGRIMEDEDVNSVHNGVVWMKEESQTAAKKIKGRGFRGGGMKIREEKEEGNLSRTHLLSPLRSVDGWIVIASGVHGEAQEDDLHNLFAECGEPENLHLNLDRRTGYVKL